MKSKILYLFITLITVPLIIVAQDEKVDLTMIEQIKKEGLQNSKVMDIAFQLTDVNGPRLTNSPGYTRAANYAKNQMTQWGLVNARLDPFGEFGKGWELERSYIAMTAPYYKPIMALPRAWTRGTNGLKIADVLLVSAKEIASLQPYKGKLAGKILIRDSEQGFRHSFQADAKRFSEDELQQLGTVRPPIKSNPVVKKAATPSVQQPTLRPRPTTVNSFLKAMAEEEGALAMLNFNPNAHEGTIIVGGLGGFRQNDSENMPDIMLTQEDYLTLVRLLKANVPVRLEMEIKTRFYTGDLQGYNVVAEIEGSDARLKDEVVMIGAHLDSWHGSTGATDNAAGVAVMMEAIRILKALEIKPRRTIRIALWGGEEQGLLGSKGYVRKTFINPSDTTFLPGHEKLSAYYNLDNGTGKIRGIYLEGNEAVRPIFIKWFEPFFDMGAKTLTHKNGAGGTDHLSFLALGLPSFQFIQDPIDYDTRTHHTNTDSYDHLIADDLKSSAVIIASILYHTAMRDEKLPRN